MFQLLYRNVAADNAKKRGTSSALFDRNDESHVSGRFHGPLARIEGQSLASQLFHHVFHSALRQRMDD